MVGWGEDPWKNGIQESLEGSEQGKEICNNINRDKGPEQGALESQAHNESSKIWRKEIACNKRKLLKDDKESNEHTLHQLLS